jgi:DNA-binding protein HU-beta
MALKKNTDAKPESKLTVVPKPKAETPEVIMVAHKEPSIPNTSRKELAASIRDKLQAAGKAVPVKIVEIMVSAYEEAIIEAMASGSAVVLPGFGKFYTQVKEAAERRNPATGEKFMMDSYTAVKFKMGSKLKHAPLTVEEPDSAA